MQPSTSKWGINSEEGEDTQVDFESPEQGSKRNLKWQAPLLGESLNGSQLKKIRKEGGEGTDVARRINLEKPKVRVEGRAEVLGLGCSRRMSTRVQRK